MTTHILKTRAEYEQEKQQIDARLESGQVSSDHALHLLEYRAQIDKRMAQLEKPALVLLQKQAAPRPAPASNRGRKRVLSSKTITAIRAEYARGKVSQATLAKKYKVSASTINTYIKGIPSSEGKKRYKIRDEEIKLVVNMHRAGLTMRQIGEKFGVSATTVWSTLRIRGGVRAVYPRKKSERRERQRRAALQPNMHIDQRLGMDKSKRGTKHKNEGRIQTVRLPYPDLVRGQDDILSDEGFELFFKLHDPTTATEDDESKGEKVGVELV